STLELVAEPLLQRGIEPEPAYERARELLLRLGLPSNLWSLAPATFSGGEQQRVNIAAGLIDRKPILLMDEPTASLDAGNAQTVLELIRTTCAAGSSVVVILHDAAQRRIVCDREIHLPAPLERAAIG
ncbi:MAG: ATP-binding cassette domain-containing protein, partial [Halofilum sp. (in: g-proteobacteria)]